MDRKKIIIRTSIYGIIVNILLVIFKTIIGLMVNSIAVILDAVNNASDTLSSVITIVGTKLAGKAPDKGHPYGHGRIEYFTAVIISVIVLIAGLAAVRESIIKIINPTDADYSLVSLFIIATTVLVKFFFGRYVKNTGKRVNSQSLVASGQDAFMDAVLSLTTLVAGILNFVFKITIEGYLGVFISFFILKSAIEMLREGVNSLIGVRADGELAKQIKDKVMSFIEVQGVYDLNLHNYGPTNTVATFHIQVRNDLTAEEIHILTREIAYLIYGEFGITVTIGIYAANDEGEFGEIKKAVESVTKEYKEILQVHGFYVDKSKNNVYFDLLIDFDAENKPKLTKEITEKMKEKYPEYNYNIILDADITDL